MRKTEALKNLAVALWGDETYQSAVTANKTATDNTAAMIDLIAKLVEENGLPASSNTDGGEG